MTTLTLDNRIRNASLLDVAELSRLLSAATHTIATYLSHGYLLVLERRDGTLEAACHIEMEKDRSTIDLLVVDPANHDSSVRQRMVGVANALCEAYGYPEATAPQRSRGRR
jgi:N-acetylglutamate synthase-like GNAT family acetyltransferase